MSSLPIRTFFQSGWRLFTRHPALSLSIGLLPLLLEFSLQIMPSLLANWHYLFVGAPLWNLCLTLPLFLFAFLMIILQVLVHMGTLKLSLNLVDGKGGDFSDFFIHYPYLIRYIMGYFLCCLIIALGICLFIIPGIILAITYQFTLFLILDHNLQPWQALNQSARITRGHKWQILGFNLLIVLFNVAGFCLLGIGLFVTVPISVFVMTQLYRYLERAAQPS